MISVSDIMLFVSLLPVAAARLTLVPHGAKLRWQVSTVMVKHSKFKHFVSLSCCVNRERESPSSLPSTV